MFESVKYWGACLLLAMPVPTFALGDDAVLRALEAGKSSFDQGDWPTAAGHFDRAIAGIETVYGKDAAKARELFAAEAEKPFRGENYERAMAFYYRGLLDFVNGDFENARASFETGLLQDSLSLQGDSAQDFASFEYLSGWASRCAGSASLAAESFVRAGYLNPALKPPAVQDKTLIIGEAGQGPVKFARQEISSELAYVRHPQNGLDYGLKVGAQAPLPVVENMYYQAVSRGMRSADDIASQKLEFGRSAESFSRSTAKLAQSLLNSQNGLAGFVGMTLDGVSMVAGKISQSVEAETDTRQWRNLPGALFVTSSNLSVKDLQNKMVLQRDNVESDNQQQVLFESATCQIVRIRNGGDAVDSYASLQDGLSQRMFPLTK